MKNRSAENMKCLLGEKISSLDLQIMHLQAVRKTLCSHYQSMDTLLTMDLSEISMIEKEECCLITIDIEKDITFEKEVELITAETARYHLGRLHDATYGSMIPVDSLLHGNFDDYTKLFIEIPFLTQKTDLHLQPKGKYLRAFHRGGWENIPQRYQEILQFARDKGLSLSGYSYEKGINETVIDRIEDYIIQIEISILG